jgi:hypothetical protein
MTDDPEPFLAPTPVDLADARAALGRRQAGVRPLSIIVAERSARALGECGSRVFPIAFEQTRLSKPCSRILRLPREIVESPTHKGGSLPACSRTTYSANQSGQSSSRRPIRFSCSPCAAAARRSAAARSAAEPEAVVSTRPGRRTSFAANTVRRLASTGWSPVNGRDGKSYGLRQCALILGTGNRAPAASHWLYVSNGRPSLSYETRR